MHKIDYQQINSQEAHARPSSTSIPAHLSAKHRPADISRSFVYETPSGHRQSSGEPIYVVGRLRAMIVSTGTSLLVGQIRRFNVSSGKQCTPGASRSRTPCGSSRRPAEDFRSWAVFPQVFSRIPQEESEADLLKSGLSRAEAYLTWTTVDLVKAGWLYKSGTGLWKITAEGRQALEDYPGATALAAEARNRYNAWSALSSEQKQEQLSTTIIAVDKDEEAIRLAARPFVERGLQEGGSVFATGRQSGERAR
jgi:hypothetical protein